MRTNHSKRSPLPSTPSPAKNHSRLASDRKPKMTSGHRLFLEHLWLVAALCFLAHGKTTSGLRPHVSHPGLPVRAVSLGGWLVIEGWILPSLFDGIPNKDLMVNFKQTIN